MISPFRNKVGGFTLIELVVVIVLIGILAGILFTVIRGPIESSLDVRQRAALVAKAETALQRMVREIRLALPNSVRINDGSANVNTCNASSSSGLCAFEFLRTSDGGRYRARPSPSSAPGNHPVLRFNNSAQGVDGEFEVLGGLLRVVELADCAPLCLLVIYNTGQDGANAYNADNTANIQAIGAGPTTIDFVRPSGTGFPFESPQQRFQIVDTPVSYICDGDSIRRYSEYGIQATQSVPPSGGNNHLLVDNVSSCEFVYEPGAATRAGLLTFRITLSQSGQSVTLSQQAHVENLP